MIYWCSTGDLVFNFICKIDWCDSLVTSSGNILSMDMSGEVEVPNEQWLHRTTKSEYKTAWVWSCLLKKKNTTCCLNITFYFLDFYFCVLHYLGNMKKCKQLLQKAVECSAVPLGMLETALQNFNSQKKQLLSDEEKENFAGNCKFLNCWLGFCML